MKIKLFPKLLFQNHSPQSIALYILHILNDGFNASFLLLLPFIAKDLSLNLTQVGFLGTLFNSLSIVLALPAGYIATKVGGMKTLILALFVYALGFLATGFIPNYLWLFVTFMIASIGFGVFHPISFALIAKWASKETRGKEIGNFIAIGDIGRIGIAAVLTFIIVYLGWRSTAMLYAAVAIASALLFYFFVLSKTETIAAKQKNASKIKFKEILTHKVFLFATMTNFLDAFASNSLFIFLPFLLLKRGVEPALLGSFTAAFFVGNFLGKTMLGRFVDKVGPAKVFIISDILMAIFIVILANSAALTIIIICSIILGVFTRGTIPVVQTMISESADHHGEFEKTFAANEFLGCISQTIAPLMLGLISDKLGIIAAFNTMAIVAVLAIIPAVAFHQSRKTYN